MAVKKKEYLLSDDDISLLSEVFKDVKKITKKHNMPKVIQVSVSDYDNQFKCNHNLYKALNKNANLGLDGSGGLKKSAQRKMDVGKFNIDVKIDLHGMTASKAFKVFEQAILDAYEKGNRVLLIITGKGNNSSARHSVLKHEFENWVLLSHISSKIIRVSQAAPKDGGSGAFYILIKRNKI